MLAAATGLTLCRFLGRRRDDHPGDGSETDGSALAEDLTRVVNWLEDTALTRYHHLEMASMQCSQRRAMPNGDDRRNAERAVVATLKTSSRRTGRTPAVRSGKGPSPGRTSNWRDAPIADLSVFVPDRGVRSKAAVRRYEGGT
ncbi:MAG: hypothetical protein JO108_01175 [Acidobacteriaceae bacterium]|nr:hypothetical protein [Acidobacteriaceae bacterium]